MSNFHQPVLKEEVLKYLAIKPGGIYIDGTFGRGGHSKEIINHLNDQGVLLAIDKDPSAVEYAKEYFSGYKQFHIRQGSFANMESFSKELGLNQKVNGILLDLGVSSPQLDDPLRGFSFLQDGPLDMRMDPHSTLDASTWINSVKEEELIQVLKEYGDERYAKRIAKAIVKARQEDPITRTKRLADIVAKANPAWEKHKHPATRSFQAIRIFINQELEDLKKCLAESLSILAVGGRLVVISFHSLEDRIVKKFIQEQERGGDFPRNLPVTKDQLAPKLKRIAWGITASDEEINNNPRSRSAILRVAEKLQ